LPCSLPGLASRLERKVKRKVKKKNRNSEIIHDAKIQGIRIQPRMRNASRTNVISKEDVPT